MKVVATTQSDNHLGIVYCVSDDVFIGGDLQHFRCLQNRNNKYKSSHYARQELVERGNVDVP